MAYNSKMAKFLDFSKDIELLNQFNADLVIGIDEVGRGAWAGPVCIGAYVLDINKHNYLEGINDSKLVKKEKREELCPLLLKEKNLVLTGELDSINTLGIGKTISNLILNAVNLLNEYARLNNKKAIFIIDGQFTNNFGENTIKRIKADSTYYSVAAASIIAKVYRDNLMNTFHSSYNLYGFDRNKGYPTQFHLSALNMHGVSPLHRTSFKPISKQLGLFNEDN